MKKSDLVYFLLLLALFNSCKKEDAEVEINYAVNPSTIDNNGNYLSKDKIALLWWDGNLEKFGLFNTNTDSIVTIGNVGDLCWWQQQCIVKNDTLYTFGYTANNTSQLLLYKNDLNTGNLLSKTNMPSDLSNLTIAGRYNNDILLLWWNGSNEEIGVLSTKTDIVTVIGNVGDLHWWQQQCMVKGDTLFTFGFSENDLTQLILYKNDLKTGNILSKINMPSGMLNVTIAGRYNDKVLLLWWNGATEDYGVLNAETMAKIGKVGDLQSWQRLCFVNENTLYAFGYNGSSLSNIILYKNDLQTGSLKSESSFNSKLINLTISKNK